MNLTLQFIRPNQRSNLLSRIYRGLRRKGCLILVEKILLEDQRVNSDFIAFHYSYKIRKGYSYREINRKKKALENILIPYTYNQNIRILKQNGFETIEEFFRWFNFCGVVAVKN